MSCAVENSNFLTQDKRVNGVGTIVYTSTFTGGTFNLYAGGWPWGDGAGVGETSSLLPTLTKPATYPTFLDATCAPASPSLQFGTWGTVITITMGIDCVVANEPSTWGSFKSIYR